MLELTLPVVVTRTISGEHFIRHMAKFWFDYCDNSNVKMKYIIGEALDDYKLELELTDEEFELVRKYKDRVDDMNFVLKNIHRVKYYKQREENE
jgi:hypothetical protein